MFSDADKGKSRFARTNSPTGKWALGTFLIATVLLQGETGVSIEKNLDCLIETTAVLRI
jgi:hypothetical protein